MASMDMGQVNALAVDLRAAGERVKPLARIVVLKSGTDIVADAKVLAPIDTGNLASSIGMDLDADGLGVTAGPTADYGDYVENGTSRMAAQPFTGPAFDRRAPLFEQALAQAAARATGAGS